MPKDCINCGSKKGFLALYLGKQGCENNFYCWTCVGCGMIFYPNSELSKIQELKER